MNFQMFKLDLEKAEELAIKLPTKLSNCQFRIIEKARECQKNTYYCFIDFAKAFVWITTNFGKFLRRW